MAATFGGNRLEAGIHASGYKETSQISPSSVQAVLHGETSFSPQKPLQQYDQHTSSTSKSPYFFSFIGGKIRKQNLPLASSSECSTSEHVASEVPQQAMKNGFQTEQSQEHGGAITLQDMDDAITSAVQAQKQLRLMSITDRRLLLERILSSPQQTSMFEETVFAATKEIQQGLGRGLGVGVSDEGLSEEPSGRKGGRKGSAGWVQQDQQRAMESIAYFAHIFHHDQANMLKGQFLYESNTTEGHLTTTLHTLSRGVVGVLLSNDVGLTPMVSILAPAIMSGCALVIKVSHSNPLIGYILSKMLEVARLTTVPGVINIVSGLGDEIGKALVMDDRVEKVIYCGSIETASKIQTRKTWLHLQKIHFRSPFACKAIGMVFNDADIGSSLLQFLPDLWMQSIVDSHIALQRNELLDVKHIFVEEGKWHELCLEVRGCLNALREKHEKFPSKVLSPRLRQSPSTSPSGETSATVAAVSGATTGLSTAVKSKFTSERHNHFHRQTYNYIEDMMQHGADVYSVPIPIHGDNSNGHFTENQLQEPIMFTAIFSDSANSKTCTFNKDLVGPVLHFHRCSDQQKVIDCANRCLIESHAWYEVVFSQATSLRDPSKCCWLNGDLKSSAVLVNHCYHNIHTKIMDNDVLDFFLKKRSVSVCQL